MAAFWVGVSVEEYKAAIVCAFIGTCVFVALCAAAFRGVLLTHFVTIIILLLRVSPKIVISFRSYGLMCSYGTNSNENFKCSPVIAWDTRANVGSVPDEDMLTNVVDAPPMKIFTSGGVVYSTRMGTLKVKLTSLSKEIVEVNFENIRVLQLSDSILLPVQLMEKLGWRFDILDPENKKALHSGHEFRINTVNNLLETPIAHMFTTSKVFGSMSEENRALTSITSVDKQPEDWQVLPTVFNKYNKTHGPFFVNVYSSPENKITDEYVDNFERTEPYAGDSFVFHPPYQPDLISKMFDRLNTDFLLAPHTTKHLIFIPYLRNALYWAATSLYVLLEVIVNVPFATVPATSTARNGKLITRK